MSPHGRALVGALARLVGAVAILGAGAGLVACGQVATACPLPTDGGPYGPDALPSGACSGSLACTYQVREACTTAQGPLDQWECSCVDGAWSCVISVHGNALCPPADGGGG